MGGKMAGKWAARAALTGDLTLLDRYEAEWNEFYGEALDGAFRGGSCWKAIRESSKTSSGAAGSVSGNIMERLEHRLARAREMSWSHLGKRISFHLPGMFAINGSRGRYPALSLTGKACSLGCDHCNGKLLESMIPATDPQTLVEKCRALEAAGHLGVLVSGGCDPNGCLPWEAFLPALAAVKAATSLTVTVHSAFVTEETALGLKTAGVDQALVDVIGSDATYRQVYHMDAGLARLKASLAALGKAGLPVVPHIICGLHYGEVRGEAEAWIWSPTSIRKWWCSFR